MSRPKVEIPWNLHRVQDWIRRCIDAGGVPMFRTRMFGEPIVRDGHRIVYGICYTLEKPVETLVIEDPPENVWEIMDKRVGEWKLILSMPG